MSALSAFIDELQRIKGELFLALGQYSLPNRVVALDSAARALTEAPDFPKDILPPNTYQEAAVLACRAALLQLRFRKEELEVLARDRQVIAGTLQKIAE